MIEMISDFLRLAINNLVHRKMRTLLTIIGIFIGIAAVVGLISLGQGMQEAITKQFEELGTDKITIAPGTAVFGPQAAFTSAKLKEKDLETIRRVKGVEFATGLVISSSSVTFRDEEKTSFVTGISLDEKSRKVFEGQKSWKIKGGRDLKQGDKYKAIVGYDIAKGNFFNKEVHVRDKLIIGGRAFRVVGTLKKVGSRMDDSTIVIPIDIAKEIFGLGDEYRMIIAKVKEGGDPDEVGEDIKKALRRERGLKEGEEDFTVETTEDLIESFKSILGIVTTVLIGIAAISLLVGGIGIMNTMYTSVLERTREIGVMKAIGARNSHILILFLFESGILGLIGGIIGVCIGIGMAKLVEIVALQSGFGMVKILLGPELIFGSLGFSFLVGTISGLLPARKAAKLNPVDALRYE